MKIILETERLQLRELALTDSQFIIELVNSPPWLKFIGDRNIKVESQAIAYLQDGPLKSYAQNGFGLYLVELKSEKKPIGICGILKRENLDFPDIGFAFLPEFTGKGYAFEVADATIAFAKTVLHLTVIYAITLPDNISSIKLLERIGLNYIEPISFTDSDQELLLFGTSKASALNQ